MKKFIYSLLAVLGLVSAASAQNHVSQNFLNVLSLNVSNNLSISNLTSFAGMTNILGVTWTNLLGTRQTVTAAGDTTKLLNDVSLWSDRNGNPYVALGAYQSNGNTSTNANPVGPANLFLRLHGGSGANSAVTFVFQPLWDGSTAPAATTDDWSVALTATTTTPVTLATNVPFYRWPGAKGLRLKSIVNSDTDASSQVTVTAIQLNGFRP